MNWRDFIPWRKVRLARKVANRPEHRNKDWYKPVSQRWTKTEKREHREDIRRYMAGTR